MLCDLPQAHSSGPRLHMHPGVTPETNIKRSSNSLRDALVVSLPVRGCDASSQGWASCSTLLALMPS